MASRRKKPTEPPSPPPADTAPKSAGTTRAAWVALALLLVACCGWALTHSYLVDAVTVALCEKMDAQIPKEKRLPVFLSEIAFDGYVWNRHAESLGENGLWRLRRTTFDNAPDGREVHWSSGFAWYLRLLGEAFRSVTGDPLRHSIFRMSIWANPILLVLAIVVFAPQIARRFGPLAGATAAIGMVVTPTFYEGFMPSYPDHHGLVGFALLGLIAGAAWGGAGWVGSRPSPLAPLPAALEQARAGMIFSAICGAVGLWLSAISTAIILGTVGLSAVLSVFFAGRSARAAGCTFHPGLWRVWGNWGGAATFAFYLLEYFPNHLAMRLEVNHPLYALAWLGGGWMIAFLCEWRMGVADLSPGSLLKKVVWPMAALAALPLAMKLGGPSFYIPSDPFMAGLWKHIAELLPLHVRMQIGGLSWAAAFGWFPVILVAAGFLVAARRIDPGTKLLLVFLSFPVLIVTALQCYQTRWGLLAGPLYIALACVVIPLAWRMVPKTTWNRAVAAGILLTYALLFAAPAFRSVFSGNWRQFQSRGGMEVTAGQSLALLHRQMARAILDSASDKPVVLLSSPNSSCMLAAFGGFKTIGTLYWENVQGLKNAAAMLNSQDEGDALRTFQKHGITHISLMTWENFIQPYFNILYPKPGPSHSFDRSFGKRALGDKMIPPWTRPVLFPKNEITGALKQEVLLLQVVPEQTLEEAKFHLARFLWHVERNPAAAEPFFREVIDGAPGSSAVRVELADIYQATARYMEAVDQIVAALPDVPADRRPGFVAPLVEKLEAAKETKLAERLREAASAP